MTTGLLAAHAVRADLVPTRWRLPLDSDGLGLRPALLTQEAAALAALSPLEMRRNRARGVPRRTAGQWRSLARLIEPLDAARAALHHSDDVRYRRAGAHAVAVVLQQCAASGKAYWGWTAWDWAAVCGPSSEAFRAAQRR